MVVKKGSIGIDVCILLTTAACVILAILGYMTFEDDPKFAYMESLYENWLESPILDIQIVALGVDCPAGYERLEIQAPSTEAGCSCSEKNSLVK